MSKLPRYKNPPLEEVAIGCQFRHLNNWFIPHTGKLWKIFEKEFPLVQHAQPIPNESGYPPIDAICGLPIPRVWFINKDESRLIQFQTDRLHFNWRKKEVNPEYPHYAEISNSFFQYFKLLKEFVATQGLDIVQPEKFELTYINHIYPESGQTLSDVVKSLLKNLNLIFESEFLPLPKNIAWSALFDVPQLNAQLAIKLVQAKKIGSDVEFVRFDFTISATDLIKFESNFEDWFNQAHEYIVNSFAEITAEEIQVKKWERQE